MSGFIHVDYPQHPLHSLRCSDAEDPLSLWSMIEFEQCSFALREFPPPIPAASGPAAPSPTIPASQNLEKPSRVIKSNFGPSPPCHQPRALPTSNPPRCLIPTYLSPAQFLPPGTDLSHGPCRNPSPTHPVLAKLPKDMFLLQGIDEIFYFGLELHDGFALTRIFLYGSQQQEDEWHKKFI